MYYRGSPPGGQNMMLAGGALGKARLALASGRADEAERLCRRLLERRPDDTGARLLLAQTLLQQQQGDEAMTQLRRVLREQPKNADALLTLSMALVQRAGIRGVPVEAEDAARRAVALQPRLARGHAQLAEVLAAKRDLPAARAEIDEAIKLDPKQGGTYLMRAVILLSDKDYPGAVQASDTALRYDRSLTQADFIKANALVELSRYDEALTALDTAARQNPLLAGPQTMSLRGRIYFKQHHYKRSYTEYLAAQRMTGRLLWLAPVLAGLNMVLSVFGTRAPYVLTGVLAVIIALIIFGVGHIPVAGPWIAVALVLAIVGTFAFAAVRQFRGAILPGEASARLLTLAAGAVAAVGGFAVVLAIEDGITTSVLRLSTWLDPLTVAIAGILGLVLAALAVFAFPGVLGRYGGGRAAKAA